MYVYNRDGSFKTIEVFIKKGPSFWYNWKSAVFWMLLCQFNLSGSLLNTTESIPKCTFQSDSEFLRMVCIRKRNKFDEGTQFCTQKFHLDTFVIKYFFSRYTCLIFKHTWANIVAMWWWFFLISCILTLTLIHHISFSFYLYVRIVAIPTYNLTFCYYTL